MDFPRMLQCPPCRASLFAREGDLPASPFTFIGPELVTKTLSTVLCVVIDELVTLPYSQLRRHNVLEFDTVIGHSSSTA